MEDLKQLKTGFASERESVLTAFKERKDALDSYLEILGKVAKKIDELTTTHQKGVVDSINEKEKLTQEINEARKSAKDELASLSKAVSDKSSELDEGIKKHTDLSKQIEGLNKSIDVLMKEHKEIDGRMVSHRTNLSILERRVRDLGEQEKILTATIDQKTKEDGKLAQEIESKKGQHARLSTDIALLEQRK